MHILISPTQCHHVATHLGAVENGTVQGVSHKEVPRNDTLEDVCRRLRALAQTETHLLLTLGDDANENRRLLEFARRSRALVQKNGRLSSTQYLVDAQWCWHKPSDAHRMYTTFLPRTAPILENPLPRGIGTGVLPRAPWSAVRNLYSTEGIQFYQYLQDAEVLSRYDPLIDGIVIDAPLGARDAKLLELAFRSGKGAIIRT